MPSNQRYHRQMLLPVIGQAGQAKLGAARVLLVGCGALGTVMAEQLARAGVGMIRIADRDIVELTNLQRQVLFDESDARDGLPKAIAAGRRLRQINSSIEIDERVVDVHPGNVEELAGVDDRPVDLLLDGTDNVQTRYLLNDVAVKHGIPWIYGACVGTEGRVLAIRPGRTACLCCIFREAPSPGELPTCDTAGVLGPAAMVVASIQSAIAIKMLAGHEEALQEELLSMDLWTGRFHAVSTAGGRREDCPCCGGRRFDFLNATSAGAAVSLCGRNAVQIRPATGGQVDLPQVADRLRTAGEVEARPYFVRCRLMDPDGMSLTIFPDGRLIVHGTDDGMRARSIAARYFGA